MREALFENGRATGPGAEKRSYDHRKGTWKRCLYKGGRRDRSGRQLAGILIGADVIKNEITHTRSPRYASNPMSGPYSRLAAGFKIIFLKDGVVSDSL